MFVRKNTDKVCKEMELAGIKEILKNLKRLEAFSRYDVEPILKTLKNILSCYSCMPNICLKKRIKYLLDCINKSNEMEINVKSLIVELETMLEANDEYSKQIKAKDFPI